MGVVMEVAFLVLLGLLAFPGMIFLAYWAGRVDGRNSARHDKACCRGRWGRDEPESPPPPPIPPLESDRFRELSGRGPN